ncbi:MerR family transcriptional regulator [Massilia sp. CCM 8695]|uniref:MerR family transcriptional regulator n=1 Tax=Massilia frigida TaxID=2609281 RepID=A0ABX0NC37_9BURK|nr:MerR family transcriptional regulator [Massilia frigida]NHZ78025.1 MerR family transcriptional regulator [Massilia frigida]
MRLKVGELASRAGVTVRALHHYDRIGLLKPSARAASGYRLYDRADMARLHQVQALRRFGLPLAEIGAVLDQPDTPFAAIVAEQISALGRQIAQAGALRGQLLQLQRQLQLGAEPDLANWLSTLELMGAYDNYFTGEELQRLPFFHPDAQRDSIWERIVARIGTLMAQGVPAASRPAQYLALRWMRRLERDTAANPDFALRMSAMMEGEPAARQRIGITPDLKQYVIDALAEYKLGIYANYLDAGELRQMREHGGKHGKQWMSLIAAVYRQMQAGAAPGDAAVQALTREWFALFRQGAGDNPATLAKMRLAIDSEPALLAGSWINAGMLVFIRQSAATMPAEA